jgi:putative FmdB family regulatory protein
MPLYDYRCERCGDFRALGSIRSPGAPAACPVCRVACAKLLSAPFLGNADAAGGWLTRAQAPGARTNWRHACGFGCNCGR